MKPFNPGGHPAYQDFFVSHFLAFYPDPFALPKDTWEVIVQFWYLDLSPTDSLMQDCYSIFGPPPRLPSGMLRSYLLALKFKFTSITDWCNKLCECPLYAVLSGFPTNDTPALAPFTIFLTASGRMIPQIVRPKTASRNSKPQRARRRGTRLPAIRPARLRSSSRFWSGSTWSPFILFT